MRCAKLQQSDPKKTIKLMQARLYQKMLKDEMELKFEYIVLLKSDVKSYMKLLRKETVIVERFFKINGVSKATATQPHKKCDRHGAGTVSAARSTGWEGDKGNKRFPVCLWPPCAKLGLRHFVFKYDKFPEDRVAELLEAFKRKKEGKSAAVRNADTTPKDDDVEKTSTLLRMTFYGAVTRVLCTDIGSNINLMPPQLCEELLRRL